MKTTIVTTTIRVPTFLTAYAENIRQNGHKDVDFIVVGDTKSVSGTLDFCATIPNCEFLGVVSQSDYLQRFSKLRGHLPFNSVSRRNIGILKAYEQGSDIIITLDDDNLLADTDPIKAHQIVGTLKRIPKFKSNTGWYNVCDHLYEEDGGSFYHRGFSPKHRWEKHVYDFYHDKVNVVVNAGLWRGDPDVDAITRLERPLNSTGMGDIDRCRNFCLAPGTWSPFNCQNTALARKVIPAYFMSPYIGRHDDIFASYVVTRLAEHFGDVIAFGAPLSNHQRSPHDLWKDLDAERWGMQNTDFFCDTLRNIELTASTYHSGFGQIIQQLKNVTWPGGCIGNTEGYEMIQGMEIWHEVFKEIL